jgi:hypothetical protein
LLSLSRSSFSLPLSSLLLSIFSHFYKAASSLAARLIIWYRTNNNGKPFSIIGIAMLTFQCIGKKNIDTKLNPVRGIYFVGVPFGSFESPNLVFLFTDLPQLMFHGEVVITG